MIGPVDVDLLGLTVTIEAFELVLGEAVRPSSDWLEGPLHRMDTSGSVLVSPPAAALDVPGRHPAAGRDR